MDFTIAIVFRAFLAGVFLFSFFSKIKNPGLFFLKMKKYNLLPKALVVWLGSFFLVLELALGIGLLYGEYIPYFGILSLALLMVFSYAIGVNILRGNTEIDCGCFGYLSSGQKIGWNLVYRNAFLSIMSLVLVLPVKDRLLLPWDYLNIGFSLIVMSILYISFNYMFSIFNNENYSS